MGLRDVLAFFGVARKEPEVLDLAAIRKEGIETLLRLGVLKAKPAPQHTVSEPWSCYFTLDDEHQVVVTVEQESLLVGKYEQTIEVQVCGSDRRECVAAFLRFCENCERTET